MKIKFKINNENGIELNGLLGDIFLSSGRNSLAEKNIYLDSWLCSLAEGLFVLKRGKNVIIDLIEESYNIEFLLESKNIKVSIPGQSILIEDITSFENELKTKIISFLKEINSYKVEVKEPTLIFLNGFIDDKISLYKEFVQPIVKEWPHNG